jgi:hypothetical protein
MCEAGGLHAGDNDRRIAADTEAVPLVVFLPAKQKNVVIKYLNTNKLGKR